MNNQSLLTSTEKSIQKFVNNMFIQGGFVSMNEMTYIEEAKWNINNAKKELKQNMEQFKADTKQFLKKLQLSSNRTDEFQEEIQSHITEYVKELISQGKSEEEALKVVFSEFQRADFSELNQSKGVDKQVKYHEAMQTWKFDEAIGLFYGGFLILGGTVGFIVASWFGLISGAVIGIGAGCVAHGFVALKR